MTSPMERSETIEEHDPKDLQIERLERQVQRSQQEIVTLSEMLLGYQTAPEMVGDDASIEVSKQVASVDRATLDAMFNVMAMSKSLVRIPFVMRFGWFKRRHARRLANALRKHGLVNAAWYKREYPEVAASKMDPALYFATTGIDAGHVPHPMFKPEDDA